MQAKKRTKNQKLYNKKQFNNKCSSDCSAPSRVSLDLNAREGLISERRTYDISQPTLCNSFCWVRVGRLWSQQTHFAQHSLRVGSGPLGPFFVAIRLNRLIILYDA